MTPLVDALQVSRGNVKNLQETRLRISRAERHLILMCANGQPDATKKFHCYCFGVISPRLGVCVGSSQDF